jgi:hypothetical protein
MDCDDSTGLVDKTKRDPSMEQFQLVFIGPRELDFVAAFQGKKVLTIDMGLHFLDMIYIDYR